MLQCEFKKLAFIEISGSLATKYIHKDGETSNIYVIYYELAAIVWNAELTSAFQKEDRARSLPLIALDSSQ